MAKKEENIMNTGESLEVTPIEFKMIMVEMLKADGQIESQFASRALDWLEIARLLESIEISVVEDVERGLDKFWQTICLMLPFSPLHPFNSNL